MFCKAWHTVPFRMHHNRVFLTAGKWVYWSLSQRGGMPTVLPAWRPSSRSSIQVHTLVAMGPDTTTRWLHGTVPPQNRILLRRTRTIDSTEMCHCRGMCYEPSRRLSCLFTLSACFSCCCYCYYCYVFLVFLFYTFCWLLTRTNKNLRTLIIWRRVKRQ